MRLRGSIHMLELHLLNVYLRSHNRVLYISYTAINDHLSEWKRHWEAIAALKRCCRALSTCKVGARDDEVTKSRCIWTISWFGMLSTSTMFKGILPSRRIPSGDFTIITNLVDDHAKENQYNLSSQTQVPAKGRTGTKTFLQMNEKKKKSDSKNSAPTQVPHTPISPQEFDKLLVRYYYLPIAAVHVWCRTISKFLHPWDLSFMEWTHR